MSMLVLPQRCVRPQVRGGHFLPRQCVADNVKFSATWEANVRYFQDWLVTSIDARPD